jgi:hypothetical protein
VCAKCSDIDIKLARYKQLSTMIIDRGALESIERLIANLVAVRADLHSKPEHSSVARGPSRADVIDLGAIRKASSNDRLPHAYPIKV